MPLRRCLNDLPKLSPKQLFLFHWWHNTKYRNYDGVICDGAIRSGKTTAMSISFVIWAMYRFDGRCFALCGKTISSLRRNLLDELLVNVKKMGMSVREHKSSNFFELTYNGHRNRFYIFGGKDESSAALIQGITLAGLLLDEVVLMPRSFVEQAVARCSVTNSKLWFNCNPDGPCHWFKTEWIDKAEEKNLCHIHFGLKDNPSLSPQVIKRYKRLYSGAFYKRFVRGEWTAPQGIVYPMFDTRVHTFKGEPPCDKYAVSCDYGTVNPSSFGLWGRSAGIWYRIDEYYYDSRKSAHRKTDEEHYQGLCRLIGDRNVDVIVCDPSAQSFIQCIRRHGKYSVAAAKNDVLTGIRKVSDCILQGRLMISEKCTDTLREFNLYRWDETAGKDCPIKDNDHAMDDIRYFVTTVIAAEDTRPFFALSLERN